MAGSRLVGLLVAPRNADQHAVQVVPARHVHALLLEPFELCLRHRKEAAPDRDRDIVALWTTIQMLDRFASAGMLDAVNHNLPCAAHDRFSVGLVRPLRTARQLPRRAANIKRSGWHFGTARLIGRAGTGPVHEKMRAWAPTLGPRRAD